MTRVQRQRRLLTILYETMLKTQDHCEKAAIARVFNSVEFEDVKHMQNLLAAYPKGKGLNKERLQRMNTYWDRCL